MNGTIGNSVLKIVGYGKYKLLMQMKRFKAVLKLTPEPKPPSSESIVIESELFAI